MRQDYPYREEPRPPRRCGGSSTTVYMSLIMIVAGVSLFMANLGFFPLRSVWSMWPLVIFVFGATRWDKSPTAANRMWAVAMMIFGAVFYCISMGFLHLRAHSLSWPFAILLITAGLLALNKKAQRPLSVQLPDGPGFELPHPDVLSDSAILGAVQRRVESTGLHGGKLNCVLGSIELDLRRVQPRDFNQPVVIEANCVLGSIKLRIPETWRLSISGLSIFSAYEDRTIPLARPDFITGTLVLTGSAFMSAVEVEN